MTTAPIRWPNVTYNDDGSCAFACPKHGQEPWLGHLVCRDCGAGYTAADSGVDSHARPRCKHCGQRLLPIPGAKRGSHYFSAVPCCTPCYEEAPGGGDIQRQHDRGSSYCLGEECPIHGAMIRKLARRAQRAGSQSMAREVREVVSDAVEEQANA